MDLKSLSGAFAEAAQRVYDRWDQNEDGLDEELGHGGICHLIADAMLDVLVDRFPDTPATTRSLSTEVHVDLVAATHDGVVCIDIPWSVYERGSGYVWTKLPGVRMDARHVALDLIDSDPRRMTDYVEDWNDADLEDAFPNEWSREP